MAKPVLIILHGALGSQKQLKPLEDQLLDSFNIHSLNFSGHGGLPLPEKFSIELFTNDLDNYLTNHHLSDVFIFGYSMGGYVALNIAQKDIRVNKIITLGTKFHWTPNSSQHEVRMLNPKKIEEKIPVFASILSKRHDPQDWKEVIQKTADMMIELGQNPVLDILSFSKIKIPVIIGRGSEDTMVTEEESRNAANQLPNGSYHTLLSFKHPFEQIDIKELSSFIKSSCFN